MLDAKPPKFVNDISQYLRGFLCLVMTVLDANEKCCARSRYEGQGQVLRSYSSFGYNNLSLPGHMVQEFYCIFWIRVCSSTLRKNGDWIFTVFWLHIGHKRQLAWPFHRRLDDFKLLKLGTAACLLAPLCNSWWIWIRFENKANVEQGFLSRVLFLCCFVYHFVSLQSSFTLVRCTTGWTDLALIWVTLELWRSSRLLMDFMLQHWQVIWRM